MDEVFIVEWSGVQATGLRVYASAGSAVDKANGLKSEMDFSTENWEYFDGVSGNWIDVTEDQLEMRRAVKAGKTLEVEALSRYIKVYRKQVF